MLKNPHPSHPGEILNDIYLSQLGWSQTRLAKEIGCPHRKVNEIVNGKRAISPEFALDLERVLKTEAEMWCACRGNSIYLRHARSADQRNLVKYFDSVKYFDTFSQPTIKKSLRFQPSFLWHLLCFLNLVLYSTLWRNHMRNRIVVSLAILVLGFASNLSFGTESKNRDPRVTAIQRALVELFLVHDGSRSALRYPVRTHDVAQARSKKISAALLGTTFKTDRNIRVAAEKLAFFGGETQHGFFGKTLDSNVFLLEGVVENLPVAGARYPVFMAYYRFGHQAAIKNGVLDRRYSLETALRSTSMCTSIDATIVRLDLSSPSSMAQLASFEYMLRPEVRSKIIAESGKLEGEFIEIDVPTLMTRVGDLFDINWFREYLEEKPEIQVLTLLQYEQLIELFRIPGDPVFAAAHESLMKKFVDFLTKADPKVVEDFKLTSQKIRRLSHRAYHPGLAKDPLFATLAEVLGMISFDLVNVASLFLVDPWEYGALPLMRARMLEAQEAIMKKAFPE